MGCGSSKVSAVTDGYGMGTEPKYRGLKQTQGQEVTILWDTDDIGCPPDNYTSLLFLNALHKVFVQNANRKEPRVLLAYDSERPLNMSPEAVALRSYLQSESVELLGSQGTTQQTVEDEIRKIVATANPKSTIVLISSPTTYQDACACARQRNIFVERLFSTAGLSRFVNESNANWMCSLNQFLKANSIPDWRFENGDLTSSVHFRSQVQAEVTSEERSSVKAKDIAGSTEAASRGIEMPATAEDLDASASPNVESPTEEPTAEPEAAVVEVSTVTEIQVNETADEEGDAAATENVHSAEQDVVASVALDGVHPDANHDAENSAAIFEPDTTPESDTGESAPPNPMSPEEVPRKESAIAQVVAISEEVAITEESPVTEEAPVTDESLVLEKVCQSEEAELPAEATPPVVDAPSQSTQNNTVPPEQPELPEAALSPQDDDEELCEQPVLEQAANMMDGEETCDSSIGHAVDTMLDDVQTGLMQEFGSSDGSSWGGETGEQETAQPVKSPERQVQDDPGCRKGAGKASTSVMFAEPQIHTCEDAIEAAVGAVEGADSDDAPPAGHGSTPDRVAVKSRLGLSMRRGYVRAASAVAEHDLEMAIEAMDPSAAAEDTGAELAATGADAGKRDAPEVVPMIGPDPTMAWKAEIMRTLRAAGDKAVKVETLLGMVPHPECAAGGEYRQQLEDHVIGRNLAVWAEDGYAIQLV